MKKYFILEETYESNKYMIKLDFNLFPKIYCEKGSYTILQARVINLTFDNYCRMCRDVFKAEISGKNSPYIRIIFTDKNEANRLLKILNDRMNIIMQQRRMND